MVENHSHRLRRFTGANGRRRASSRWHASGVCTSGETAAQRGAWIASLAVGVCFAFLVRVLGARGALDDGPVLVAGGESGEWVFVRPWWGGVMAGGGLWGCLECHGRWWRRRLWSCWEMGVVVAPGGRHARPVARLRFRSTGGGSFGCRGLGGVIRGEV